MASSNNSCLTIFDLLGRDPGVLIEKHFLIYLESVNNAIFGVLVREQYAYQLFREKPLAFLLPIQFRLGTVSHFG